MKNLIKAEEALREIKRLNDVHEKRLAEIQKKEKIFTNWMIIIFIVLPICAYLISRFYFH